MSVAEDDSNIQELSERMPSPRTLTKSLEKEFSKDQSWDHSMVESIRKKLLLPEEYEAIEKLEATIQNDPENIEVLYALGMKLLKASRRLILGNRHEMKDRFIKDCLFAASTQFQTITTLLESEARAYAKWSECLSLISATFELPLFDFAMEYYKKAIALEPENYKILYHYASDLTKHATYVHNFFVVVNDPVDYMDLECDEVFEKAASICDTSYKLFLKWGDSLYERLRRSCNVDDIANLMSAATSKYIKAIALNPKNLEALANFSDCLDHVLDHYVKHCQNSIEEKFKICFYQYLNVIRKLTMESDVEGDFSVSIKPLIGFSLVEHATFVQENAYDILVQISKTATSDDLRKEAQRQLEIIDMILESKGESLEDQKRLILRTLHALPSKAYEVWEKSGLTIESIYGHYDVLMNSLYFAVDKETSKHPIFSGQRKKSLTKQSIFTEEDLGCPIIEDDPLRIYPVYNLLGTGGFGMVYSASNKDEKVAIKVIRAPRNSPTYHKVINEIVGMKRSKHKNIVEFKSCYYYIDQLFIVMEYCDGGTLRNLYKEVYLTEDEIAYIIRKICLGVAHLHSKGLVHLDLKSENILLHLNGKVKIADFGLVRQVESGKESLTSMMGTCHWMAPEIIQRKKYGQKVDIWSLGCVCLELAQGFSPNSMMTSLAAMFYTGTKGTPSFNPNPINDRSWGASMVDFISQTMHPEPSKRPTALQLLNHPFISKKLSDKKKFIKKLGLVFIGTSLRINGLL